jgi:thioredoxin reductase
MKKGDLNLEESLQTPIVNTAIVGAGPYGLSLASHLSSRGVSCRIFGSAMASWRNRMPARTLLKSDGFASSLYDPTSSFTLAHYCREFSLPYADVGLPVPIETFVNYGLEFQRRFVPHLETTDIVSVETTSPGFKLTTSDGEIVRSKNVVIAVGITHFGFIPPSLSEMPREFVTHSSQHAQVSNFHGRRVAVVGGGASAIDLAGLLQEAGADVHLIARRPAISFHEQSREPRSISQRLLMPRSGLGLGWRSRLCTDAPLLFHSLPSRLRRRAVQRHLGPAAGWFAKERFVGRVTNHLGTRVKKAELRGNNVVLTCSEQQTSETELVFDHVIAATGYKVSLDRLQFIDPGIRQAMAAIEGVPTLNRNFQSSIRGLYFVGLASANSFGPLCRFAYGAKFTSRRLSRHLEVNSQ